jgi:NAD(P)-dependent dehydrogenase (short-subunit alcohol dehydrogenase family)
VETGSLSGKIAAVTGASRGLGKGIALDLGEAGATVYVTGRSTAASEGALPGTIDDTADEVTRLGGVGVAVRCDHRVDSEVEQVFAPSHAAGPLTGGLRRSRAILPYSVCKAGLHRLTANMAADLADLGIAVVEVWPPASTTEGVLADPDVWGDLSDWKPPLLTGRVIAAFASTGEGLARTGQVLVVDDLAEELGVRVGDSPGA